MAKQGSYEKNRTFSAERNLKLASGNKSDPTAQPQATSQSDVDNQDWRTRLWQSIQNGANYAVEQSNKAYTQAIGAADRQATSRGMGRSSYNIATQANMGIEQANAANKILSDAIADYQNRVTQQENEEWQRSFQQQQFNENQRQFNENLGENQRQFNENLGFQRERANKQDEQWGQQFGLSREQWEWQKAQQAAANQPAGGSPSYPSNPNPNPGTPDQTPPADPTQSLLDSIFGGSNSNFWGRAQNFIFGNNK